MRQLQNYCLVTMTSIDISIVCPECQRVEHASYCSQSEPRVSEPEPCQVIDDPCPWPDDEVTERYVFRECQACQGSGESWLGGECSNCNGQGRVIG